MILLRMTEMTICLLSGVGGRGVAYINGTVDKMSFVIFVIEVGAVSLPV